MNEFDCGFAALENNKIVLDNIQKGAILSRMKPKLSHACSKYGAQMGRCNRLPPFPETVGIKLYLQKIRMSADGCYDEGGAYWGFGDGSEHVYWAVGTQPEQCEIFVWATDRDDAKTKVREIYPQAKFYR